MMEAGKQMEPYPRFLLRGHLAARDARLLPGHRRARTSQGLGKKDLWGPGVRDVQGAVLCFRLTGQQGSEQRGSVRNPESQREQFSSSRFEKRPDLLLSSPSSPPPALYSQSIIRGNFDVNCSF